MESVQSLLWLAGAKKNSKILSFGPLFHLYCLYKPVFEEEHRGFQKVEIFKTIFIFWLHPTNQPLKFVF